MKTIEVTDADVKQATVVLRLLQEAKFEIKGDALSMAAGGLAWATELIRRLKEAKEPEVVAEEPKTRGRK